MGTGDVIFASLFNAEYNQLVDAFNYSSSSSTLTGHRHDGSTGEGGNIPKIGSIDFANRFEVDTGNNWWTLWTSVASVAEEQLRFKTAVLVPVQDDYYDIGSAALEFKDLWLDGTANVDVLQVDENATVSGLLTVNQVSDGAITITGFVDEDDMVSDSATLIPTQQSVKAYVDTTAGGTVASVAISGSDGIEVDSGSPITTSGTIVLGLNKTTTLSFLNVEDGATGDQSGAEIKASYEAEADTNAFDDAAVSKLTGIEALADVTDTTNVTAAGALMDSEVVNLVAVKAFDPSDYEGADATILKDADIGVNVQAYNANTVIDATYVATDENFTTADHSKLDGIEALADVTDATNVNAAGAVMNTDTTTAPMSFVVDEDDMVSDSATKVPTQQSTKAYVDAEVAAALTSEMSYKGGYNASTNTPNLDDTGKITTELGDVYTVTVAGTFFTIDVEIGDMLISNIASAAVEGDWTIVNKNLDAPSIKTAYESNSDTNAFTNALLSKLNAIEANATADQTGAEIKAAYEGEANTNAYTDAEVTKLAGIEALADVTDVTNVTAAGALMDSEVVNLAQVKAFDTTDYAPALGVDDNYVTDAEKVVIGNTSGTNTGDQVNITGNAATVTTNANLTGDVTSVGNATTIPSGTVEGADIASTGETAGKVLQADGDNTSSWVTLSGGGDALVADPLSQFAATTSAQLAGVISDETGSGALVFGTSPTLVTPNLGTPSTLVGTNITGTAAGLTVGATTGVEAGADVTDAANVNAAGAVMESDTSTASMSFVIDDDSMATASATKLPTSESVVAYVNRLSAGLESLTANGTNATGTLAKGTSDTLTVTPSSGTTELIVTITGGLRVDRTTGTGSLVAGKTQGGYVNSSSVNTGIGQSISHRQDAKYSVTNANFENAFTATYKLTSAHYNASGDWEVFPFHAGTNGNFTSELDSIWVEYREIQ